MDLDDRNHKASPHSNREPSAPADPNTRMAVEMVSGKQSQDSAFSLFHHPVNPKLAIYSGFVLLFNLFVILWGAVVRATGSGAGCADHWPDCGGQVIPTHFDSAKAIEFTHRVSSGLAMLLIFALGIWVFRTQAKRSPIRRTALLAVFFGLVECGIGAVLVLFKWVAKDTSVERAIAMACHHCNTAILIATLVLTSWMLFGGEAPQLKRQGAVLGAVIVTLGAFLASIVSGAITALGDTLFPPKSTIHTMQQALSQDAHFLERLRILHPPISVSASILMLLVLPLLARWRPSALVQKLSRVTIGMALFQLAMGFLNVALKAPLWMQLFHLLIADIIWVLAICTVASVLAGSLVPATSPEPVMNPSTEPQARPTAATMMKAYVALTKPRVISLLLFTTILAMFIGAGGVPNGWQILWVAIGGYMAAGAANAINMVIDSDIDVRMKRTASRPTVTHLISPGKALIFALTLAVLSCVILTWSSNALTAVLAMAGLLFYVLVYTLLLKRRTWQNIVIGGAAGAFPPLVGYAAVTGQLSPLAWFLFALIFFWTPVHFWALALLIKDDYAEAGIPMLPVVHGERATVIQITAYAVLTALISAFPLVMGDLGWIYLVFAGGLNIVLVLQSWQLMQTPDRPHAVRLFKFSMVYLALVFVVIAVDQMAGQKILPKSAGSPMQAIHRNQSQFFSEGTSNAAVI